MTLSTRALSSDESRVKPLAFLQRYGREIGLPIIVLLMVIVFSINSAVFLSLANFRNIGVSAAALAAALGKRLRSSPRVSICPSAPSSPWSASSAHLLCESTVWWRDWRLRSPRA